MIMDSHLLVQSNSVKYITLHIAAISIQTHTSKTPKEAIVQCFEIERVRQIDRGMGVKHTSSLSNVVLGNVLQEFLRSSKAAFLSCVVTHSIFDHGDLAR